MVGADLDVSRSEGIPKVFEKPPMTVVLPRPWHVCGTTVTSAMVASLEEARADRNLFGSLLIMSVLMPLPSD
jgi:hypothetical protein